MIQHPGHWYDHHGYCSRCGLAALMVARHALRCEVPAPAELRARRAWARARTAGLRNLAAEILADVEAGR